MKKNSLLAFSVGRKIFQTRHLSRTLYIQSQRTKLDSSRRKREKERWRNTLGTPTEETQECHTLTQTASGTSGLVPLLSLLLLGSIPTCGNSPINGIGMTKQCCMSITTGRRPWPRSNHINLSGMNRTERFVTRTTSTGLYIFPRQNYSSFWCSLVFGLVV